MVCYRVYYVNSYVLEMKKKCFKLDVNYAINWIGELKKIRQLIYVSERLTPSAKLGTIASNNNCRVSTLVANGENERKLLRLHYKADLLTYERLLSNVINQKYCELPKEMMVRDLLRIRKNTLAVIWVVWTETEKKLQGFLKLKFSHKWLR